MIDIFTDKPDKIAILNNANGTSTIVLRKNIIQDTSDKGPDGTPITFWKCDFTSRTYLNSDVPTMEYIEGRFDELYMEFEDDNIPDTSVDPQLQAIARMQVQSMELSEASSSDAAEFKDYWPEWEPDKNYGFRQPLKHKGSHYRTSKALTSSSVYPPDTAGESMYYPIEIADDGIIVYRDCHGSYDAVQKGETRHYPDAKGPVYRSLVNNNSYSPSAYPDNWEFVTDSTGKVTNAYFMSK